MFYFASMWRQLFHYITGSRRHGHALRTLSHWDYDNPKIVKFLCPYAVTSGATKR